ncbi:hypothetical protein EV182_006876 [Spiromyces aspiralis]|uniref:Uncharacterized protein n=1 Tax=Spiromyces aspiralis TaxID=68401 RepID=A0ACC1H8E4_9FUNG|nr:hypothetical protein EV182_006876 [Spiromyces aspiralis]
MLTSIRALSRSASRAWAPHLARLKTTEVEKAKGNAAVSAIYQQAPNYPTTWSDSQQTRKGAMTGPRFEQTDLESQPRPLASIELINEVPIKFVKGRKAVCDGGKGYTCLQFLSGYGDMDVY